MEKVKVIGERCKSCGLCVAICPRQVLVVGNKANSKGYYQVAVTDQEKCISCGLCFTICPDLALEIYK